MLLAAQSDAGSSIGEQLLVLGILFVIAYALGRLGKLVGLPAIPIYMLVGLIASPHFAFFPIDVPSADVHLIAIFGLIFLLFNLGLEFDQDAFFGNFKSLIISGGSRPRSKWPPVKYSAIKDRASAVCHTQRPSASWTAMLAWPKASSALRAWRCTRAPRRWAAMRASTSRGRIGLVT